MDERSHTSTADGGSATENLTNDTSPPSSGNPQNEAALEAAEYLLSHGLIIDHKANLLHESMLVEPYKLITPSDDPTGLPSSDGLPECSMPATVSTPDKWGANDTTILFLHDVCKRESETDVEGHIREIKERRDTPSIRQLKLELPALRTDEHADLRQYKRRASLAREVRFDNHGLFLMEPCSDEKDEGLDFPQQAHATDREILRSVEREMFETSKASFQMLAEYRKSDWTEADQEALLARELVYKGLIPRDPVTPPITPKLEAQDVYVPDAQTCAVPMPSSQVSALSDDLRKAEECIFEEDGEPTTSLSDIEKLIGFEDADEVELSLPNKPHRKRDDLEVELPLLPIEVSDQPPPPPGFGEVSESLADNHAEQDVLQPEERETELDECLKESAAKVMMEIEQEKLEPLDGSIRVDVPVLDFSIPEAEWSKLIGNPKAIFQSIPQQYGVSFKASKWSSKLIDESKMGWKIWMGQTPNLTDEEPIEDAILPDKYLRSEGDENLPRSSDYVKKKPGLRVLEDDGDDDEEIQPLITPTSVLQAPQARPASPGDWLSLLKKRKPFNNGDNTQKTSSKRKSNGDYSSDVRSSKATSNLLVQDEEEAAATLLDNYMALHAPKKPKLDSPFFNKPQPALNKEPQITKKHPERPLPQFEPELPATRLMPCPEIPQRDRPVRLITAVTLSRSIITNLERLLPGIQLIDRDYSAHNTSVWVPGSVHRAEVVASALADEAHLIPSPSTGIMLTTMIKLRQRQLPGGSRNKKQHITTRVEAVAARYERLIVLVSEDNQVDENATDLTSSDSAAFAEFQGFAAALPCEMVVMYVGGGAGTLAKWVAAMVAQYAAGCTELQRYLCQQETHWEVFLRRAGMNVYAAQVVLGMLRAPVGEPVIDADGVYGLPAFVRMSQQERVDMFQAVLGGRTVLRRVGEVLDANWEGSAPERRQ